MHYTYILAGEVLRFWKDLPMSPAARNENTLKESFTVLHILLVEYSMLKTEGNKMY